MDNLTFPYPDAEKWYKERYDKLSDEKKKEADQLTEKLIELGISDPGNIAVSELDEDEPENPVLSATLLNHQIYETSINTYTDPSNDWVQRGASSASNSQSLEPSDYGDVLNRMIKAGVSEDDIRKLARGIAYETAFTVANALDEGNYYLDDNVITKSWNIFEVDEEGNATRNMGGLHEYIGSSSEEYLRK
ncbi:MAG: hypothetical protein Q7S47_00735 [bacterium]|nr:hypothetical protein [bacterium]